MLFRTIKQKLFQYVPKLVLQDSKHNSLRQTPTLINSEIRLVLDDFSFKLDSQKEAKRICHELKIESKDLELKTYLLSSKQMIVISILRSKLNHITNLAETLNTLNYETVLDSESYMLFKNHQPSHTPYLVQNKTHEDRLLQNLHSQHPGLDKTYINTIDLKDDYLRLN